MKRYMQATFPKETFVDRRPLILCYKEEVDGLERVKIYSDVPTPSDVYFRFVHEEFFEHPPHAYTQCRAHGS